MNKSRNNPKSEPSSPKKPITKFVRNVVKLETEKKSPIFESQLTNKETIWMKKPNDSWDY